MHKFRGKVPQFGEMPVEHDNLIARIDDNNGIGGILDRRRQQIVREGQFAFGAFALRDVGEDALDGDELAVIVAQRVSAALEPDMRTVRLYQAEFAKRVIDFPVDDGFDVGRDRWMKIAPDVLKPADRRRQQLVGLVAVPPDVLGNEDQLIGFCGLRRYRIVGLFSMMWLASARVMRRARATAAPTSSAKVLTVSISGGDQSRRLWQSSKPIAPPFAVDEHGHA